MIGRRAAARLARRYAGRGAALPAPRPPGRPAGQSVVQLWFTDDTSLALTPDDPLARALQAIAAAIVGPPPS
ncbi:MAG: hypothetical protein ACJ74O_03760 [Frankiaceae bacterium]